LIGTAKDLGPAGRDDQFGYGEVDPLSALREPVAEVAANPLTLAAPKTESGKSARPSASATATAIPNEQGGAAPLPAVEAAGLAGARQAPAGEPVGSSITVGLVATLLILIVGAAGVLVHHRTRRPDRF
jgi:hypothetical protein